MGIPVWFTTVDHVIANQTKLLRLIGAPNASMPELVLPPRRNATGPKPFQIPRRVRELYEEIEAGLMRTLEGTCVAYAGNSSMYAHRYDIRVVLKFFSFRLLQSPQF